MANRTRSELKEEFARGSTLTAAIFVDLIDSCYNVADDNSAGSSEVPKVAITLQELYDLPPVAGGGDLMLSSTVGALSVTGDQDILLQSADAGDTLTVSLDQSANEIVISVSDVSDSSNIIVDSSTFTASNSSAASVATIDYGQTIIIGSDAAGGVKIQSDATVAVRDAGDAADQKLTAADPAPSSQEVVTTNYLEAQLVGLPGTGDVVGPGSATDEAVARYDLATGKLIKNSPVTISDAGDMAGINDITLTGTVDGVDIATLDASVTANTSSISSLAIGDLAPFTLAELNVVITDGDVDDDACCRPPCGVAGGDLSGTYPDPQVVAITEQDATPGDGLGNRYPIGEVSPGTYLYVNPVTNVLEGRSLTSITGSVQATTDPQKDSSIVIWTPGTDGEIDQTCITITGDDAGAKKIMTFESGSIGSPDPGSIWYEDNVFNMKLDQADPVLQVGQETWTRVKNNTGVTIPDGTVVYISGVDGGGPSGIPEITPAMSDQTSVDIALGAGDPNPSEILGVTTQEFLDGQEGFVTTFGLVRGLNLATFSVGAIVYLDPLTPGGLTDTVPIAPNSITRVGIVVTSGGSGTLLVQVTEPTSINDIGGTGGIFFDSSSLPIANGSILSWVSGNNRFEIAAPPGGGAGFFVGNTIYVDSVYGNDGSGSGDDPGAAFATIGAAIDSGATSGDIIVVMPGEYPEEGLILPDGVALVGTGGWGQTFIGSVDAQEDILTLGQDCYLNGFTFKVPHKQYITSVALTQPAGTNGIYNINFEGENRSDIYAKLVLTSNFLAGVPGSGDRIFHKTAVTPDGGPLSVDFNYCFVSSLTVGQHTEAGVVEVLIGGTAEETLQNLIAAINDDGGVGQNGVDGSGRYQYNQLGGANTNTGPNPYLTAAFESGSTDTVIFTTTQEFGSLGFTTQLYVIENIADAGSAGSIFPGIPVNDFGWGTSWPPSSNDGDFPGTGASLGTAPYNNGVVSAASYITYALGTAMFRSGGSKTIGANIRVEKGGMEDIFRCDQGVLALEGTHVPFSPGRTVNKLRTTVKSGLNVSANGHPNFSGTSDDFKLDASLFGGNDYTYTFISPLPGVAPAANTINVLIGADLEESLANLIAAVNNAGNAASGTVDPVGGRYFLGTGVGAHDSVVAVPSSGVSGFGGIKFEQRTSGEAGAIPATQIELTIDIASAGPSFDIRSATATLATVTGVGVANEPFVLLAAGRTQFLNFNCGDPNLENAIKVDGGSSDAQPACLVFTPNIFNCTNAIHSDGKYQSTNLLGGRIENVTYGVRVLDGSASAGVLTQAEAEGAKYRISANHQPDYFYPPESAQYSDFVLNYSQETTDTRDASYNIFGQEQLSVGFSERGADSHLGRGAPYQAGMVVLTSDAAGTLFEVNTEPANSKSGSTFTFPGQTGFGLNPVQSESILLGSLRRTADPDEPLKFWGAEIDVALNSDLQTFAWQYEVQRWHNPFLRLQQAASSQPLPDTNDTMVINFLALGGVAITIRFVTAGGSGLVAIPAANEINVYIGTQTTSHEAFTSLVNALTNAEFIPQNAAGVTYAYGPGVDYATVIEPYLDARFQAEENFTSSLRFVEFISKEPQSAGIITVQYNCDVASAFAADFRQGSGGALIPISAGGTPTANLEEGWYETKYHVTSSAEGYSYGDTLFYRDNSSEKIRFGLDSSSYWLPTTITPTQDCAGCDPSGLVGVPLEAYWIRIVNTGSSSTGASAPTIERIKLIESATNISKNGVLSCTGLAQFRQNISLNGNIFADRGGGASLGDNDTTNFYQAQPYTIGGTADAHLIPNSVLDNVNGEIMVQFPLPAGISTAFPLTISMYFQYGSSAGAPVQYLPCDIILNAKVLPVSGVLIADNGGASLPVERIGSIVNQFNSAFEMFDTKRTVAQGVATSASPNPSAVDQIHKLTFNPIDISKYYEGDVVAIKLSLGENLNDNISLWSVVLEGVQFQAGQSI